MCDYTWNPLKMLNNQRYKIIINYYYLCTYMPLGNAVSNCIYSAFSNSKFKTCIKRDGTHNFFFTTSIQNQTIYFLCFEQNKTSVIVLAIRKNVFIYFYFTIKSTFERQIDVPSGKLNVFWVVRYLKRFNILRLSFGKLLWK